jgi:hypothetical protein
MNFKKYLGLVRLLLLVLSASWGMNQGIAQTKSSQHKKSQAQAQTPAQPSVQAAPSNLAPAQIGGRRVITDAAGRVHVRNERITYAQRKAAAERRVRALREAQLKKQQSAVKK